MRNAKVLEFPKNRSMRKRIQDKVHEQKAVLILSIASVLIMTVFLNQYLVPGGSSMASLGGNRNVASIEGSSFKDIKWEQDLAKKISVESSGISASLAEAPTLRDDLVFGFLEGKYGMKVSDGRIRSLEFIDSQAGEQALLIANKSDFLAKYSEAFGLSYSETSLVKNAQGESTYSLIDEKKMIVGEAHFIMDDKGRVQTISFTQ